MARRCARYDGPLFDKLFDTFEELFTKGDGLALMFEQLSGQEVNTILLDCLMYEDDELFAHALALLERTFGQRRKLIEATRSVRGGEERDTPARVVTVQPVLLPCQNLLAR